MAGSDEAGQLVVDLCVVFLNHGLDQVGVEVHVPFDNFQATLVDLVPSSVQNLPFVRFLMCLFLFVIGIENTGNLFIVRELLRQFCLEFLSVYLLHLTIKLEY